MIRVSFMRLIKDGCNMYYDDGKKRRRDISPALKCFHNGIILIVNWFKFVLQL